MRRPLPSTAWLLTLLAVGGALGCAHQTTAVAIGPSQHFRAEATRIGGVGGVKFEDDFIEARLANRPDRVADLTLAELRAVTLTSGARIPTLEEALEACGPTMLVNIELKTRGYGGGPIGPLVDRVAAIVDRTGCAARVLVSSFHPRAVWSWMRRAPSVPAGLLFEAASPLPLRAAWAHRWLRPRALHPEAALCTPPALRRWHALGYLVNVWTVDEPPVLRALAEMGVDGIITNDPARTRGILV